MSRKWQEQISTSVIPVVTDNYGNLLSTNHNYITYKHYFPDPRYFNIDADQANNLLLNAYLKTRSGSRMQPVQPSRYTISGWQH